MRSRSSKGGISSIYSPVNEASVTVARSEPEPLTQRIRAVRPRKSTSSALAEVLPPPQLQTERSAPSMRDRATSCASTVDAETFAITANPFIDQVIRLNIHQTKSLTLGSRLGVGLLTRVGFYNGMGNRVGQGRRGVGL